MIPIEDSDPCTNINICLKYCKINLYDMARKIFHSYLFNSFILTWLDSSLVFLFFKLHIPTPLVFAFSGPMNMSICMAWGLSHAFYAHTVLFIPVSYTSTTLCWGTIYFGSVMDQRLVNNNLFPHSSIYWV